MPQVVAVASAAYTAAVNFVAAIPGLVAVAGEGGAILAATTTVNFAINASVAFGINAISRQSIPDAEFASSNRKQAIPDRLSGYGRARLGGAYMLWEAEGSFAYNVLALHDGQVDGFEQIYLNDDKVTVSGGYVQAGTDGRYGRNNDLVQIDTRLGLPTETRYSQITDTTIWPTDARGDGIASLMMIAKSSSQEKYLRDFPNGLPLPSAVTRMQICYDARIGTRDNPAAWAWTRNPVWQLLDYMTNAQTGMGLDYEQYFEPQISTWITAADVCDEAVPLAAGGTIPRYTGDGTYLHSTPPADVIATILACMDGWIAQDSGGVFVIEAGEYTAPTVTITDAHIVGMDRQFYLEDERAVNELVISYTSPEYDYTEVEALPWRDETDILDRNGSVRSQRMSLPWVSTNSQARRLAKIAMAKATAPIRGTITTDLYGLKAMGQRRIRIQAPADSVVMADIVVDVVSVTLNSDFTLTIPFVATSAASYEWDAATEENSQPIVPRPVPSDIAVPVLLSATYDDALNRIEVTVEGPVDEAYEYQLSWNAQDGDPPQQIEFPVPVVSGSDFIVYTTPTVPVGELIDVMVAFVTSNGAVGEYSNVLTVPTDAGMIAGSLTATEANDTLTSAASVGVTISGALTATEADDTLTGAATAGPVSSAWNPADKGANQTLSNSNRTVTQTTGSDQLIRGTLSHTTGPYKVEFTLDTLNSARPYVGLCVATCTGRDDAVSSLFVMASGDVYQDGTFTGTNIGSTSAGQTIAFDISANGLLTGVQRQGGSRTTFGTSGSAVFPAAQTVGGATCASTINTGQAAFVISTTGSPPAWG